MLYPGADKAEPHRKSLYRGRAILKPISRYESVDRWSKDVTLNAAKPKRDLHIRDTVAQGGIYRLKDFRKEYEAVKSYKKMKQREAEARKAGRPLTPRMDESPSADNQQPDSRAFQKRKISLVSMQDQEICTINLARKSLPSIQGDSDAKSSLLASNITS